LERAGKARGEEVLLEDVLGRRIWDVFPELVGSTIYQEYHRAVREQKTVVFETYSPLIDAWVEVHAYPSQDGGLSIYAYDIIERKHAQEQLRYHASLLDNVEDGVIATDASFVVTAWNRGAERLFGWSGDEVLGRHVRDVVRTRLSDEELDVRFRGIAEEGRARTELVVYRKDGTTVDVEMITVAIRGERSEVTGYLAIHRDVSERRRSEQALRDAHQQTETVLERITDFFVAFDREWRHTYLNRRVLDGIRKARREGVALEDLLGRSVWEVNPELVGTTIDRELHRAVREQRPVVFESCSQVTGRWMEMHAYPSRDGLSVYARDITERKEAEQRVVEAREAERGRIARALHDEALQGLADAIALAAMSDRTTAESRLAGQLLPVLQRVGQQLRGAIYDLRLESEEHLPFVELLERLVDEHRAMAGDSEIEVQMGDGVPTGSLGLKGIELLRILGEALTNARRHADARRVLVRVWGTKDGLWVEVSDDGRGFEIATPVSPVHHGIRGMRERAEMLNGRLEVHTEPGVGTRVRLEAPLANGTREDL
jgi:PAS domain S-box-containing protein